MANQLPAGFFVNIDKVFVRDDGRLHVDITYSTSEIKGQKSYDLDKDATPEAFRARVYNDLTGFTNVDALRKTIQPGPFDPSPPTPPPDPTPEKTAYLTALQRFGVLSNPAGMGLIDKAAKDRAALKQTLEDGYDPSFFGL